MKKEKILIGTRGSKLALIYAQNAKIEKDLQTIKHHIQLINKI